MTSIPVIVTSVSISGDWLQMHRQIEIKLAVDPKVPLNTVLSTPFMLSHDKRRMLLQVTEAKTEACTGHYELTCVADEWQARHNGIGKGLYSTMVPLTHEDLDTLDNHPWPVVYDEAELKS